MRRWLPVAALLAAPLAAAPAPLEVTTTTDSALKGWVAGKPQTCLPLSPSQNSRITGDGRIVYDGLGGRTWVTGPIGPCPSLQPMHTLIVRVWGSQICRNDLFQTLLPGNIIPSAPCRFSAFTPYRRAKPAE